VLFECQLVLKPSAHLSRSQYPVPERGVFSLPPRIEHSEPWWQPTERR